MRNESLHTDVDAPGQDSVWDQPMPMTRAAAIRLSMLARQTTGPTTTITERRDWGSVRWEQDRATGTITGHLLLGGTALRRLLQRAGSTTAGTEQTRVPFTRTTPTWLVLAHELELLNQTTPDPGLVRLTQALITHPAHHTGPAVDALAACGELVAAAHDTPMQASVTATLDSLAHQATTHDDPTIWPHVHQNATTHTAQITAWRADNQQLDTAVAAPLTTAHRDDVHAAFAALAEHTSIETRALLDPHPGQ